MAEKVKVVVELEKDLYDRLLLEYTKLDVKLGTAIANGALQKQGHWKEDPDWRIMTVKCSECGHEQSYTSRFCPECGTTMQMRSDI